MFVRVGHAGSLAYSQVSYVFVNELKYTSERGCCYFLQSAARRVRKRCVYDESYARASAQVYREDSLVLDTDAYTRSPTY